MRRRKFLWLLWLLCAGILYFFGNDIGTWLILMVSLLVPLVSLLLTAIAVRFVQVDLALPKRWIKKKTVTGEIRIRNRSILPVPRIACRIRCKNWLTGRETSVTVNCTAGIHRTEPVPFSLSSSYCGWIRITVDSVRISDVFGLWSWEHRPGSKAEAAVFPETFSTQVLLVDNVNGLGDGDRYSLLHAGNDPGEVYAIREYAPGDPIRQIHWKLSQKTDRLMVRELGLPLPEEVLLLAETAELEGCGQPSEAAIDAVVEALDSVSSELLRQGTAHTIGWRDNRSGALVLWPVSTMAERSSVINKLLANTSAPRADTVSGCLVQALGRCAYAHVAVISPHTEPDVASLYNGNRVTLLRASSTNAEAASSPDGTFVCTFRPEELSQALAYLEL